jgi:hypothetical protein
MPHCRIGDTWGLGVEVVLTVFSHLMSFLWVIGMVGCAISIPITAYRLFAVLFERDDPDEK